MSYWETVGDVPVECNGRGPIPGDGRYGLDSKPNSPNSSCTDVTNTIEACDKVEGEQRRLLKRLVRRRSTWMSRRGNVRRMCRCRLVVMC